MIVGDLVLGDGSQHEYTMTTSSPGTCTAWDFPDPDAVATKGEDINSAGVSVGGYENDSEVGHGYVHDGTFACRLEIPGARDSGAEDVNDFGVVVGIYDTEIDGSRLGFIAVPQTPPVPLLSSWGLLVLGAALVTTGAARLAAYRASIGSAGRYS